jgi:hypothetical protein
MKRLLLAVLCLAGMARPVFAQDLYVNTEPASNMATGSVGIRLENQGYFKPTYKTRTALEVMYGASRNLMLHASLYAGDYYHPTQHFEGGSVYAKYRFLSVDSVQTHFRGAFFAKLSNINNPVINQEITLEGDNSGLQTGVVFTQLLHKLALAGSVSYLHAWDNAGGNRLPVANAKDAIGYTLSSGYLLLPKRYKDYSQTNLNVYAEFLGKINPGYGQSYLDAAPAVQLIFNSTIRVDFSYRIQLYSNIVRNTGNVYLVRVEYNLFR